ncbi:MFS domain-containing protein [Caerostris darwini]|uniref:MFS domain-containing protein n=1 Tax=Caerostris darwini TaxID=1538125 RepID=A0AAV4VTN7_9ARAC|nr:MFS domain-containing protein [Caerostris darwini]
MPDIEEFYFGNRDSKHFLKLNEGCYNRDLECQDRLDLTSAFKEVMQNYFAETLLSVSRKTEKNWLFSYEVKMKTHSTDSCYSWIIAVACHVIHFLLYGMLRVAGLLFVEAMVLYNVDREVASLPFVICFTGRCAAGPVSGFFAQIFGFRKVVIFGGVISSIGIGICFFASNIHVVNFMWGVVFGLGMGTATALLPQVINLNFKKHGSKANGLSLAGVPVAGFVLSPIVIALIEGYGLNGTFLILSAIVLNSVPAAMLIKIPSSKSSKDNEKNLKIENKANEEHKFALMENNAKDSEDNECNNGVFYTDSKISIREKQQAGNEFLCDSPKNEHTPFLISSNYETMTGLSTSKKDLNKDYPQNGIEEITPPLSSSSIEKLNDVPRLRNETQENGVTIVSMVAVPQSERHFLTNYSESDARLISSRNNKSIDIIPKSDNATNLCNSQPNKINPIQNSSDEADQHHSPLTEVRDPRKQNKFLQSFKIFLDPMFILISISRSVTLFFFFFIPTVIVDFSRDKYLTKSESLYILMSFSGFDLFGKLALGWITDCGYIARNKYIAIGLYTMGASLLVMVWSNGFAMLMVGIAGLSVCVGTLSPTFPGLLAQYMSKEKQTMAIASSPIFMIPLNFSIPPLMGYFRDDLGSYDGLFYTMSVICFLCGMMVIILPCVERRKR